MIRLMQFVMLRCDTSALQKGKYMNKYVKEIKVYTFQELTGEANRKMIVIEAGK